MRIYKFVVGFHNDNNDVQNVKQRLPSTYNMESFIHSFFI